MGFGYQCDACAAEPDTETELTDQEVGALTLNLEALPLAQRLHLAIILTEAGLLDMTDMEWTSAMMTLQGKKPPKDVEEMTFNRAVVHLCAGHTLTILNDFGIADIPDQPGDVPDEADIEDE